MDALVVGETSDEEESSGRPMPWGPLSLFIEVEKGSDRKVGDSGYTMFMHAPYGYVEGTVSMEEGDALDVFLNPESDETSGKVYIVGMLTSDGVLEEEKVFLNFESSKDAKECFLKHYDSPKFGYIYVMRDEDFIAMARARVQEATLKNAAFEDPEVEVEDEPVNEVEIPQAPELLVSVEEKSIQREPIYDIVRGLTPLQKMALIESRKALRK